MDVIDWMDCHCETMVWLEILCQILSLADFSKWPCTKYFVDFKFGGLSTRNHGVMLHYPHAKWMYTACVQMSDSQ